MTDTVTEQWPIPTEYHDALDNIKNSYSTVLPSPIHGCTTSRKGMCNHHEGTKDGPPESGWVYCPIQGTRPPCWIQYQ